MERKCMATNCYGEIEFICENQSFCEDHAGENRNLKRFFRKLEISKKNELKEIVDLSMGEIEKMKIKMIGDCWKMMEFISEYYQNVFKIIDSAKDQVENIWKKIVIAGRINLDEIEMIKATKDVATWVSTILENHENPREKCQEMKSRLDMKGFEQIFRQVSFFSENKQQELCGLVHQIPFFPRKTPVFEPQKKIVTANISITPVEPSFKITQDYEYLQCNPILGCNIQLLNSFLWDVKISPSVHQYSGKTFTFLINFDKRYPNIAPKIQPIKEISHPNFRYKKDINLKILTPKGTQQYNISDMLKRLIDLFGNPALED